MEIVMETLVVGGWGLDFWSGGKGRVCVCVEVSPLNAASLHPETF